MSGFSRFIDSTVGKISIGVVVAIAVVLVIFEAVHFGSGDESRVVPPQQVASEAQQQIDAINKMTNLTPDQKKAMIAHEQGEINTAKGSAPLKAPPSSAPQGAN